MKLSKLILFLLLSQLCLFSSCKSDEEPIPITPNTTSGANTLLFDEFEGTSIVIVGNKQFQFIVAFERTLTDGTIPNFEVKQRSHPVILTDEEGNEWDIFGRALSGPRTGEQLVKVNGYMGFWFAFGSMYPGVELYDGPAFEDDYMTGSNASDWTISTTNVISVLGQDAIPAIDNPMFELYDDRKFIETGEYLLDEDDLVIGVLFENKVKLYPHRILNWHEVVNDELDGVPFTLSFCPITGTSVLWERRLENGELTTFGVSGVLYNGNVITFDRSTTSLWSQMKQSCVNGILIGESMKSRQIVETTWSSWKLILNNQNVMTTETGFSKDYSINPYEPYIADQNNLSYPVDYRDERLPLKERVFGVIINGKAKAYQFKDF